MPVCSSLLFWLLLSVLGLQSQSTENAVVLVGESSDGLVYATSALGDRIPDFSFCGYEASNQPLPEVPERILIQPSGGDDTQQIQSAINFLALRQSSAVGESSDTAKKSLNADAATQVWQGAVVLAPGEFHISSTLYVWGTRIVLRGAGTSTTPTRLVATGYSRRPAIVVGTDATWRADHPHAYLPINRINESSSKSSLITQYVPIGSTSLPVEDTTHWKVGQSVIVAHPSTQVWINSVGMNQFPSDDGRGSWLDWKPGTRDQYWHRTISSIAANTLELDAPLTNSLNPNLTQAFVYAASGTGAVVEFNREQFVDLLLDNSHDNGRRVPCCHHLGVENLTLVSQAHTDENPLDEEHAWDAIRFSNAIDCWASHINCQQFVGSAIHVGQDCRRVTVADCNSRDPISEDAGGRRLTFHNLGQQVLFLRCRAEDGRHDFTVGPLTSGPNAFVNCTSLRSTQFSGPIGSWATGVLYDNVQIDGTGLELTNRETEDAGAGWCAANCVLWNCTASQVVCRTPPTGFNLASGILGQVLGDGTWRSLDQFTSPESLFRAQLEERIGKVQAVQVLNGRAFVPQAGGPSPDRIDSAEWNANRLLPQQLSDEKHPRGRLQLKNGWLILGDQLAIGKRQAMTWWRGSVLPNVAPQFGPGLTRFVPGCDQRYFTDPIADVADQMQESGTIALEHHWGLWYDRRRDDHLLVRRASGQAIPPFYEQPWSRSGQGTAWDGLSKYDLQRFNRWYFDRLSQFATRACQRDLILIQYMYFQHNLLESGAHWVDFPWRPVNCLQSTGFTEPPVTQNRKRITLANEFYDVTHPVRRELHVQYIRHCLDTLGQYQNVIFALGEEFTGPAEFIEFWLDTAREWMQDNERDVLIMLSACHDAQEVILRQTKYCQLIDIVDVKYWWHTSDGHLYAPKSGQNMAPRQQLREWKEFKPTRSADSLSRSVQDLRQRFPEKAVICSVPHDDPWALLVAGISLPSLPATCDQDFLRHVVCLEPARSNASFTLKDSSGEPVVMLSDLQDSTRILNRESPARPKSGRTRLLDCKSGIVKSESDTSQTSTEIETGRAVFWVSPLPENQ